MESLKDFVIDPIYISLIKNLQATGFSLSAKNPENCSSFVSTKTSFSSCGGGVGSSQRSFFYSVLEREAIDREKTRGLESGMSWS
jgi:hypothetical protein